jgi:hypothetical protein
MMTRRLPRGTLRAPQAAPKVSEPAQRWSLEWIYFALVVVAWCVTPLVRRLIDYHQGAFNPIQVTSLIPFVMMIPFALVCFRPERLARLSPLFRFALYAWAIAFLYALAVGAVVGVFSASAFEFVEYLFPVLAGIWLAGQELSVTQSLRRLVWIFVPCAAAVAIYGLFQWMQPPPWDVMWVQGSDFQSVGDPSPFVMRLFSTLNAPEPAADFFALMIVLVLPLLRLRTLWVWPLLSVLGAALLLSMIREAWVAVTLGSIAYLVMSPRRLAVLPSLAVYVVLLVFLVTALPSLMGSAASSDIISSRLSTLTDIDHDTSALERQQEIADSFQKGFENPAGTGLGTVGAAAKLSDPNDMLGNALDSGYLARFIEMGWAGALAYLAVVLGVPIAMGYALFRPGSSATLEVKVAGATALALCATLAWSDAANDAHLGLDGFFFWLALGLGSLAVQTCTVKVPKPKFSGRVQTFGRRNTPVSERSRG